MANRIPILGNFKNYVDIKNLEKEINKIKSYLINLQHSNKQVNIGALKYIKTNALSLYMDVINSYVQKYKVTTEDNYGQKVPINRIFYRGENQVFTYPNIASVYRGEYSESSSYHVYMKRFYSVFKDMNNFSKLTYMQHFGIPTRLLDITSNALVALFFACHPLNKKDGAVYIMLPRKNKYIIYNNYSDFVEILSTLALLKDNTKNKIFEYVSTFNNYINKHIEDYLIFYHKIYVRGLWTKNPTKNRSIIRDVLKRNKKKHLQKNIQIILEIGRKYTSMYHTYDIVNFLHKIRQDIGDFKPDINFQHFSRPIIVSPAINNKRIEAQHGCFIFENFSRKSNNAIKEIENQINNRFNIIKIIIPGDEKLQILKSMDRSYGINSATLFPDYENVSKYVSNKYKGLD